LAEFERQHGHPPRILHIGNIANNAFSNAKVLNRAGLDCDVVCYDYYNIMACPEWEDAQFDGSTLDPDRPDWCTVDLGGYERPRWFAQGPLGTCLAYLNAKRSWRTQRAEALWHELCRAARLVPPRSPSSPALDVRQRLLALMDRAMHALLILRMLLLDPEAPRRARSKALCVLTAAGVSPPLQSLCLGMIWLGLRLPNAVCRRILRIFTPSHDPFDVRVAALTERFRELFPQRVDCLQADDCQAYRSTIRKWARLFKRYDLVVGYATDPIHPMLAQMRPYVAFEHGTIRDIPFERTPTGRLTSLAYAEANVVYLTNADSLPKAEELRAREMIHGLHGFDDARLRMRIDAARSAGPDPSFDFGPGVKVFFAPARQHWRSGFPTWRKGNDLFIEAAATLAQQHPGSFRLVLVEWGAEVELSKALVRDLGLAPYVTWIPPMGKANLLRAYRSVDCVIDQFVLPCVGSVTLEAIAVGHAPVITALDDDAMVRFYGESIPLFNCHSVAHIHAAMYQVVFDTAGARRAAAAAHGWFERRHSGKILVDRWFECLSKTGVFSR